MEKPPKPYPEYPLFPHASGQWAKKIKGSIRYFGLWSDHISALNLYESEKVAWEAGVNPRTLTLMSYISNKGLSLDDGVNIFLDYCDKNQEKGKITKRSYNDYVASAKLLFTVMPRTVTIDSMVPMHWERIEDAIREKNGEITSGNHINRILVCFNWLVDNQFILKPKYGTHMKRPSKASIRIAKRKTGKQWFDRGEIVTLLAGARPSFHAMILLGVNCGFGNADCSRLKLEYFDLENGWVDFPRPKTGVDRRAKLWPETIQSIEAWLAVRPKFNVPWLFITRLGNQWSEEDSTNCQIAKFFRALCKDVGLHLVGRGFYGLRRTCETVGSGAKDQVALDYVMGHIDQSMGGVYRQSIDDERLVAVSEHIRRWLFPTEDPSKP